jgi:Fic family protein
LTIFSPPPLSPIEQTVLKLIEALRDDMKHQVSEPHRWMGSLRRMSIARAVQASNTIEGYNASLDDVAAAVAGEPTLEADEETELALIGYRDAMTYVLQLAKDEHAEIDEGIIKSLHFMMLKHELKKSPGRWRAGYIAVADSATGDVVYEGPDAELIPELVTEMLSQIDRDDCPELIRAAMAHLNLVMIHPFRDGNGRMARCLQTLVLARNDITVPVFASIEEYLGRNTRAYYDVLAQVGQGAWNPNNDARPWIEFCLTAHYRQAKTHLQRTREIEQLWRRCSEIAAEKRLSERTVGPLMDAALGFRLRNSRYRSIVEDSSAEEITELTATRDLQALVKNDLLAAGGETRGRFYVAAESLVQIQKEIRATRPPREEFDPFHLANQEVSLG